MSADFKDLGGGKFEINGVFGYSTVADLLSQSKDLFADYSVIEIDLSGVTQSDSAGLALLLEWVNWSKYFVREIHYKNVPQQITSIAEISEVEDMLHAGERWTGREFRKSS